MQVHALVDRRFPKIPVFSDEETSMICSKILASGYKLAGDGIRQEQPRDTYFYPRCYIPSLTRAMIIYNVYLSGQ